jgi:hypothetical protein
MSDTSLGDTNRQKAISFQTENYLLVIFNLAGFCADVEKNYLLEPCNGLQNQATAYLASN